MPNKKRGLRPACPQTIRDFERLTQDYLASASSHLSQAFEHGNMPDYQAALSDLRKLVSSLRGLIHQKSKVETRLKSSSKMPGAKTPEFDSVSSRAERIPKNGGSVHMGQGQTRRPGSRRSPS